MKTLIDKINNASSLILTTHRQCDGDGLGSQLALYYALKKTNKKVRLVNVDPTPRKYRYLKPDDLIDYYNKPHSPIEATDLTLAFDTNDYRLLEPLHGELKEKSKEILFIDHHPILKDIPPLPDGSWIDTQAASTGEIVFNLINELGIELDQQICRAIYTSIVFDTQLFRLIRNSPRSHEIAAILLQYNINPDEIHHCLFSDYTKNKMDHLSKVIGDIEYFEQEKIAVLKLQLNDIINYKLRPEETMGIVDVLMSIETVEGAIVFRETDHIVKNNDERSYKISFRSKGLFPVLPIAEELGGGGHKLSAGVLLTGNYEQLKESFVRQILKYLESTKAG